jgi:hypothetical protein
MRARTLFFLIAALLIAGPASAQKTTWASQGPAPSTADFHARSDSNGNGDYDSDGYWCGTPPPLEISTESASTSSFASGPTSGVLVNDGHSGSFSDYVNAPSTLTGANLAAGSTSTSLGEIARALRQKKGQATQGPMVVRQDNLGRLQVCDAAGGNCRTPQ